MAGPSWTPCTETGNAARPSGACGGVLVAANSSAARGLGAVVGLLGLLGLWDETSETTGGVLRMGRVISRKSCDEPLPVEGAALTTGLTISELGCAGLSAGGEAALHLNLDDPGRRATHRFAPTTAPATSC